MAADIDRDRADGALFDVSIEPVAAAGEQFGKLAAAFLGYEPAVG